MRSLVVFLRQSLFTASNAKTGRPLKRDNSLSGGLKHDNSCGLIVVDDRYIEEFIQSDLLFLGGSSYEQGSVSVSNSST